ncbi:MAG: tRNA 5-methoxyuridine(34)/uridine 5-oxyacetic acid(34) synthase CmoB [Elusimicrobiota bacterium]
MINYSEAYQEIKKSGLARWIDILTEKTNYAFKSGRYGDIPKWQKAYDALPNVEPAEIHLNNSVIQIGTQDDISAENMNKLEQCLKEFHPWRKGPFNIFGIHVDTEWRSDFKWDRFNDHITTLKDKVVLDIGCGSGYHTLRMLGAGAKLAIGIEPNIGYVYQFYSLQKYINDHKACVLPIKTNDLTENMECFDTVFSMGILYHRKNPIKHLLSCYSFLKKGGELVLETIVSDGDENTALVPEDRYAKMRNVWFIPSCGMLEIWLKKIGFKEIKCVNVSETTGDEQRTTEWMRFQSLSDYIDKNDPTKTVEGYPIPKRAVFIAKK